MPHAPTVSFETTIHVRDTCLCLHAQRAARVLARRFDEALRPFGLTNNQFSLLNALNRPQPASIAQVSALLGADRTTLTAALKPLVREGLATSAADPEDSRIRRIALTPAGHARLAAALDTWKRTHVAIEADAPGLEPARLRHDLDLISASRIKETTA